MLPCSGFSPLPATGRWQRRSPNESCTHFARTPGSYTPVRAHIDPPLSRAMPIPKQRSSPEAPRPTPPLRCPPFSNGLLHRQISALSRYDCASDELAHDAAQIQTSELPATKPHCVGGRGASASLNSRERWCQIQKCPYCQGKRWILVSV